MQQRRKPHFKIGDRFGKLVITGLADDYIRPYDNAHIFRYTCHCDCGNDTIVRQDQLSAKVKPTRSCGCLSEETQFKEVHGLYNTRIYKVYESMMKRCYNENSIEHWDRYGGRGIYICDEWLGENGISNFAKWAYENGFDESAKWNDCSIDRIDLNKPYAPWNCRFGNSRLQANNRSNNRYIIYNNETHTMAEWERIKGYPEGLIFQRLRLGWTEEEAINGRNSARIKSVNAIYFLDKNGMYIEEPKEEI